MNRDDVDIIARETVYDGYMQLYEYRLRHRLFDGGWSGEVTRELLSRGNAVCVLPYDPVRDEVVLVEQFRIGAYAADLPPWQCEIVAGIIEAGEREEDVARREMREECGIDAGELQFICRVLNSSGMLSETAAIYCAIADTGSAGGVHGVAEESEDIRAFALPFRDAFEMIAAGTFQHSQGIIALQWLASNRDRLRPRRRIPT